ncbi:MAG TPA: integrase core domain-containing protein [Nitrososphaeraceae archaeon]|jgi:transposase-like protein
MTTELTTRQMRGLEIANTLALQRLNKLTYRVQSQSDPNKWYIATQTYKEGWICECPDYVYRHLECKHIHAVKFSKLLRKKIYQDTFAPLVNSENLSNYNAVDIGQVVCPKCVSSNYKKFGIRHNKNSGDIQRYLCKACNYRYTINRAFENSKASAKLITAAVDLYFKGVSLRKIADHLKQFYGFKINCSSICRWLLKFGKTVQPYVDSLVPQVGGVYQVDEMMLHVRKEDNKSKMTLTNPENHTNRQFDNHYSWLWNLMDSSTRFWICSRISQKRNTKAGIVLFKEMKKRAPIPSALIHDGLPTYDDAYNKELYVLKNPRIQNVRSIGSGHQGLNSKVERLNGTVRDREKVMHGLDKAEPTQDLVDAMRIHYNFIRPHQALKNRTPADKAGIALPLSENKIESLMRLAAVNKNDYASLLGIRINKVRVIKYGTYTEIKPIQWLSKKEWREINEVLIENGFEWKSCNIDSSWIKTKP